MNDNLPKRKDLRLKFHDYSSTGVYSLTICTQNRCKILSNIVVEGSPLLQLTVYGKIVDKWINAIPQRYSEMSIDYYVIMPNHIHLLLAIEKADGRGDPSPTVKSAMGWFKYQSTKEINQMRKRAGEKVFQRSYYDHIVRNQQDYEESYKYIHENPLKWQFDELYCE